MRLFLVFLALCRFFCCSISFAGEADVVKVDIKKSKNHTYNFSVTVSHEDVGWEHYANKWEIIGGDSTVLGTRILLHPHVNEQPFTRSLSNVEIPDQYKNVTIRAHDSVHEYGGKTMTVEPP